MEANSLRIGNLLYFSEENIIRPVTSIQVGFYSSDRVGIISEYHDIIEFKPIELNENWLIKFGFKKGNQTYKNGYSIEVLKTDFYLRPSFMDGYYWGFNISNDIVDCELNDVKRIKYVHQLQNLYYAITGEELNCL